MHTLHYSSPIGMIAISGDEGFIHRVSFTEQPSDVKNKRVPGLLEDCASQLERYFEGSLRTFSLPLQQEGTAFQQQVWDKLHAISFGRTVSYLDIAIAMNDRNSIRAVGGANGKNNIAIIIPCHRVIGSNSKLTGYAGGLWRKQWLLEHEAKVAHGQQMLF